MNITYKQVKNSLSKHRIISGLAMAFLLCISAVLWLLYPFASSVKEAYFHGENPILLNGHQVSNAIVEKKAIYVPYSFLANYIDKNIIYDKKSHSIIITTSNQVVQMPSRSFKYYVNEKPVKMEFSPVKLENGKLFVAVKPLLSIYAIQCQHLKETDAIWIQTSGEKLHSGQLTNKNVNSELLRLRTKPSIRSSYTSNMKKSEKVFIEGEKRGFYFVRKQNGIGGFIDKDYVNKGKLVTIKFKKQEETSKITKMNGPIQLTWEAVYTKNPDLSALTNMANLNVVSPTWFSLAGKDGTIKNLASLDYSNWAHSKGFKVWGLFSNSFDPSITKGALKDYHTRQKIIVQLLNYSKLYHLQGINFDIENVNKEDGPLVTQLMREARPILHEAGLTMSADITFAVGNSSWSAFYERTKLSHITDYLVVMAYDEHYGAATGEGSVASLPWVEKNLKKLLKEVPHDRLILGVPLYTRLWKEEVNPNGEKTISSKALSMENVQEWISEKGLQPTYDPKSGQNYVEYKDKVSHATYKIWIEDELSLQKRAELVLKYDLAGIASWSRYFGNQTAWDTLDLNQYKTKVAKK